LAALTGLLARLLLLLIGLLLATTALLTTLTGLLARLLALLVRFGLATALLTTLAALILTILSHNYLQLECELSRDRQLPAGVLCSFAGVLCSFAGVLCSFQQNIHSQRSFGPDDRKSVECRLI
jgi:hypothetical protein